jgi:putative drug exporter of the RND superfamily
MSETASTTVASDRDRQVDGPKISTSSRLVRAFVIIAVVEAFTWAGLLVGMYLKHVAEVTELGVRVFGSLHGAAFIVYVLLVLATARSQRWSLVPTTALALAAAVPPFATVAFERAARRRGLLDVPA